MKINKQKFNKFFLGSVLLGLILVSVIVVEAASITGSTTVIVEGSVDLKVTLNGSGYVVANREDGPLTISYNSAYNLNWDKVDGADTCTLDGVSVSTGPGSVDKIALGWTNSTHTFTLSCKDVSGAVIGTDTLTLSYPPIPTNMKTSCSADGKTATLTWTNVTGYNDQVYTRAYPGTYREPVAFSDYIVYDDSAVGEKFSFPVIPGEDYTAWVHTRADNQAYSDGLFPAGMVVNCSAPKINPDLKVSVNYAGSPAVDNSDGPELISYNSPYTLKWGKVDNATSCQLDGFYNADVNGGSVEWRAEGWANSTHDFLLKCKDTKGNVGTDTVKISYPAAPTNMKIACNADATNVTISWTNVPGYNNQIYTRVHKGEYQDPYSGAYMIYGDDAIGSSLNFNIEPKTKYTAWVHTRADSGAYSTGLFPDELNLDFQCVPVGEMFGVLTTTSPCYIPLGQKSCLMKYDWEVTNPERLSGSAVTESIGGNTIGTGDKGTRSFMMQYGSDTLWLYNNAKKLDTKLIEAICDPVNTAWDSTTKVCANIPQISVKIVATPAGTIGAPLLSPAATDLSWTTTGNPDRCDASGVEWSGSDIKNGDPVTKRSGIPAGKHVFSITCYKDSMPSVTDSVTVVVNSTDGTCTDGEKNQDETGVDTGGICASGDLLITPNTCEIAEGRGACPVTGATWSTVKVTKPELVDANTGIILSSLANKNLATEVWAAYPQTVFNLKDGVKILDTKTVTTKCVDGTEWDQYKKTCVKGTALSVSLIATPAGPMTAPGATDLSWTATGSPDSCDAAGIRWSGVGIYNGEPVTHRSGMPAGNYVFGIVCHKAGLADATSTVTVVVDPSLCPLPTTQDVTVPCDKNANGDNAISGSVTRSQIKNAECKFPDLPVTKDNSQYVSDDCKYPPSCRDGIQNQDETGVDTGGVCGTGGGGGGSSGDGEWGNCSWSSCDLITNTRICTKKCNPPTNGGADCPGNDGSGYWTSQPQSCDNGGGGGGDTLGITLIATPAKIFKGKTSVLTWSSSADSCIATKGDKFITNSRPTNLDVGVPVAPLVTTEYEITCTKGNVIESKSVKVKVDTIVIKET